MLRKTPKNAVYESKSCMKEQKVIVSAHDEDFDKQIEDALKEGWSIIPESLKCTSEVSSPPWVEYFDLPTERVYSFTAVFEREI